MFSEIETNLKTDAKAKTEKKIKIQEEFKSLIQQKLTLILLQFGNLFLMRA